MTGSAWFKTLAIIAASVTTSLTPIYGKEHWYIAFVGVANGLALVANSVVKGTSSGS